VGGCGWTIRGVIVPTCPPARAAGSLPACPALGGDERPSTMLSLPWQAPPSDAAPQRPSLLGRGASPRDQRSVSEHRETCPPALPQSNGDPGGHSRRASGGGRASVVSTPVRRSWWPGVAWLVRRVALPLGHTPGSSRRSHGGSNTAGNRRSRSPGDATRAGPRDRAAPRSQRRRSV